MDDRVRVIVDDEPWDLAPVGARVTADELWESLSEGHFHPDQMIPTVCGQLVRVRHISRALRVPSGPSEAVARMFAP